MKKVLCVLILTMFCGEMLQAADLKTKDGKIYESYCICGTTKDGIRIMHKEQNGEYIQTVVSPEIWPDDSKSDIEKYKNDILRKKKLFAAWLKTPDGKKYLKFKEEQDKLNTVAGRKAYFNKIRKMEADAKKREEEAKKKEEAEQKRIAAENAKKYLKSSKGSSLKKK